VSFPRSVGHIPTYYNRKATGRPLTEQDRRHSRYNDSLDSALYPFGYGLSYTTFAYANLQLSSATLTPAQKLTVSVDVTDTGGRPGAEIVQLYVRDLAARVTRPIKELRGFQRIALDPGQTRRVTFTLDPQDLAFYDRHEKLVLEPGQFKLWIGPNSAEGLEGRFALEPG
jgi:beta-glucosidase